MATLTIEQEKSTADRFLLWDILDNAETSLIINRFEEAVEGELFWIDDVRNSLHRITLQDITEAQPGRLRKIIDIATTTHNPNEHDRFDNNKFLFLSSLTTDAADPNIKMEAMGLFLEGVQTLQTEVGKSDGKPEALRNRFSTVGRYLIKIVEGNPRVSDITNIDNKRFLQTLEAIIVYLNANPFNEPGSDCQIGSFNIRDQLTGYLRQIDEQRFSIKGLASTMKYQTILEDKPLIHQITSLSNELLS